MCSIDYERCKVWREQHRKARKPHVCDGCGGPIATGKRYLDHGSFYDGYWSWGRLCEPCEDARETFANEHEGMLPIPNVLRETLQECAVENGEYWDDSDGDVSDLEPNPEWQWALLVAEMDARRDAATA